MHVYQSKLGTALTAILLLTGCGGGGSSSSPSQVAVTSTPPPAPVVVTPPPAPDEPTVSAAPARNILEAVTQETAPPVLSSTNLLAASQLSGVAAKGVLGGARIIVFDPLTPPEDVGEEGAILLGEGATNPDGTYSLTLQSTEDTSNYLAIGVFFDGATMVCDAPSGCLNGVAFGEPVTLGETDETAQESEPALWAIFPKPTPGEDAVVNVNLFTHFQLFRMLGLAIEEQADNDETDEPVTLNAEHFMPAFDFVSNAFGLETDLFHTVPYVDPAQPIGSSDLDAIKMGLLSAGFLEAGVQTEIFRNGDEANVNEVLADTILPFLLPNVFFVLNEDDTDRNPRNVSLEDMFEAALQTAEINSASNNSLSLAIDFLTEQNALIDMLTFNARLEADGTYPEERRVEEEPEPEPEPESAPDPDPALQDDSVSVGDRDMRRNQSCQPNLSPQPTDEIVLLSGYEGTAYSSVAVTSLDRLTGVTRVRIEAGETPLYIVASTLTDMIWSIEGDTNRVAGFVAANGQHPDFDGAGVVGLPEDKVDFIDYACMQYFSNTTSRAARNARSRFENIFARDIDHLLSSYTLDTVAIPSGEMMNQTMREENEAAAIAAGQSVITADNGITFNIESQTEFADQTQLFRFTREGLATVSLSAVVSSNPVQDYDVVPAHAGLVQLLSSGQIEYIGQDNSYTEAYFIHETFPRFPALLAGAHSVRFTLGTGVELPGGDIGHSRVFSEETGECILGLC